MSESKDQTVSLGRKMQDRGYNTRHRSVLFIPCRRERVFRHSSLNMLSETQRWIVALAILGAPACHSRSAVEKRVSRRAVAVQEKRMTVGVPV